MKKLLLLFIVIGISMTCMGLDVQINLYENQMFNLFYASSIDPDNPHMQPIIFRGDIAITNEGPNQIDDYILKVGLKWNGDRVLIDETVSDSEIEAIQPLIKGIPKVFTSRDVISNVPTNGFIGKLTMDGVLDENPDFKDVIMETGRFPDGEYAVTLTAYLANDLINPISNTARLTFTIINPMNIQLLFPGTPVGKSVTSYPMQRPTFMWISNMREYQVKIVEVDTPSNFTSEMIEGSIPVCEITTHSTAFPYPASEQLLEIGHTYAWQVKGRVLTAGGANDYWMESPVFIFQIADPNDDPVQMEILYSLLNNLQEVDGMEDFLDLLNQGYAPTGNVIYKGQSVPFSQLNDFISDILSGEVNVKSITVE